MKRGIIFLVAAVIGFTLISCGKVVKNAATIAGAGTATYQSLDGVYEMIHDNIDAFSPRDVVRLRAAGDTLLEVKAEVYAIVGQKGTALNMVADLPKLIPLYEKAKIAYVVADGIVMKNIDEFSRQEQMTLYAFQDTCLRFDVAIMESMEVAGKDNVQLVRDIVGFIILVGKIVLPLAIS